MTITGRVTGVGVLVAVGAGVGVVERVGVGSGRADVVCGSETVGDAVGSPGT
ncbi:hypothetical protein GCM10022236_32450 [Microlunatus ginsengisoli]|uniref:Uncharacterized protein n=1 Tax=Microlunatus ginsengisoli TaxID=363863 RepID=A0ABP7A9F7_9ACTN